MRNRIRMVIVASAMGAASLAVVAPGGAAEPRGENAGFRGVVKDAQPVSAAEAAKLDQAILADSHGCSGNEVSNNTYVHVCFVRDGDKLFVKDDETNGRSAVGQIDFRVGGEWNSGRCISPYTHASGKWHSCGFSQADENKQVNYRGFDLKGDDFDHMTGWHSESSS